MDTLAEKKEITECRLKELYCSIRYPYFKSSKYKFKVFTYEASLGKTYTMCYALKNLYEVKQNIHTLIVTKLKDEQEILKYNLGNIAMVINSDEDINEEFLYQYPILIITHARYLLLCKNKEKRKFYTKGRRNLIIDEQLDIMDMKEYNQIQALEIRDLLAQIDYYSTFQGVTIKLDLASFWGKILEEVNKSLSNNYQNAKMKFVVNENEIIIKQIDTLNKLLDKAKFPKKFKNCTINWRKVNAISYKDTIKVYIQSIKYFFNNKNVIATGGRIYTYNPFLNYFMLENNIMLDASGKFLEIYKICDKFKVIDSERIISHSNTTLTFLENNSTTNAIENNENYYKVLSEYIQNNITDEDKVLIIGRKNDEKNDDKDLESLSKYIKFEEDKIEFVNFDAMRGKNEWSDFNKCFCVHIPNKPFHFYPLQYLYYSKNKLIEEDIEIQRKSTNMGFANETIENLRLTDVVSNIYQGLKRVSRNNIRECNYYVVAKDTRIQNLLIEQFYDLKEIKYDELKFSKQKYSMSKRNENSIKTQITEWIENIWDGNLIKTKDILKEIGITQKQFDKSKENKEFQNYLKELQIKRGCYQKNIT